WAANVLRQIFTYRTQIGNPSLSTVSVVEILSGLERETDPTKAVRFRQQVGRSYRLIGLDEAVAFKSAEIVARLANAGATIGLADSVIAATALENGLALVTSNTRHFERVIGAGFPLRLEDWRIR